MPDPRGLQRAVPAPELSVGTKWRLALDPSGCSLLPSQPCFPFPGCWSFLKEHPAPHQPPGEANLQDPGAPVPWQQRTRSRPSINSGLEELGQALWVLTLHT